MGHIRLGSLPRTRKWQQVVGLIQGGARVAQVAVATIAAAEKALGRAADDPGVVETVWLLTQLPLAARAGDFPAALRDCGLPVSDSPGLMEVVGALSDALDAQMPNGVGRTDLGEMAQMAAAEVLTEVIGARTRGLFGTSPADVQKALADLATVKQFGTVARGFFARFTNKCLGYFLSRVLADQVGEGRRFATLAQQAEFSKALKSHCNEAAVIVERFSGEWFSKANWVEGGISRKAAAAFTAVAMRKLVEELTQGARPDGE
jgi:hypothetical protein